MTFVILQIPLIFLTNLRTLGVLVATRGDRHAFRLGSSPLKKDVDMRLYTFTLMAVILTSWPHAKAQRQEFCALAPLHETF